MNSLFPKTSMNGSHSSLPLSHLQTNPIGSTHFSYPIATKQTVPKLSDLKQQ